MEYGLAHCAVRPARATNTLRRLAVHGGAYQTGASNDYDGNALVAASQKQVVVVTINCELPSLLLSCHPPNAHPSPAATDRLNVFGFLGSSEVAARTKGGGAGNFGIQDQRAAIAWTKAHIGAFGGDGDDITIFGESAGGNSVINHLAQPASFGLYTKAIIESGAYDFGAEPMSSAQASYAKLLTAAKCSNLDCLVSKTPLEVGTANGQAGAGGGPVVDGVSLTDTPVGLIEKKTYNNKVPVIIGSNRDEAAFFTLLEQTPQNMTDTDFDAAMIAGGMKPVSRKPTAAGCSLEREVSAAILDLSPPPPHLPVVRFLN